jgi:lipopolysaccharide/colanic/teichoic acid biosynthesis glycosyltransferase
VRKVDSIVSFDAVQIAVVLPDTPPEGAVVLGERVADRLAERKITARFRVHSEPRADVEEDEAHHGFAPLVGDAVSPMKRASDVVGGLLALLLLSPVIAAVALYVRAVSPGPILFRQARIGHMGRPFTMLKFRTMHVDADQGEHESHVKQLIREGRPMEKLDVGRDARIIPGGRFLRRTCLDELPQLINVLRGEMSLIGPRPEIPYATDAYRRWHRLRFNTIPGMTGLWQVNRTRATTFDEMARLDISYASERSTLLDLAILLSTLPIVFFGRNGRALGSRPAD